MIKFKNSDCYIQFEKIPESLKSVCTLFEELCTRFGIIPVVTRIVDAVKDDSGVHEAHRAIDFRDETALGRLFTDNQVEEILNSINEKFPRTDGHLTAIHHRFEGGMLHFHFQVPEKVLTLSEKSYISAQLKNISAPS